MNSILKFNKHVIDFQSSTIQEFVDDLYLFLPEDIHSIIDHRLNKYIEQIKVSIKNTNIKTKNKKPSKHTAWKLFAAHKSKDFPDLTQAEKWSACSPFWKELKQSGEDKYWQDLADKLNDEQSPEDVTEKSDTEKSDTEPEKPEESVKKPKAAPKKPKATPKTEPAPKKKPASKKKSVGGTEQDDDTLAPEQYIQINMDE